MGIKPLQTFASLSLCFYFWFFRFFFFFEKPINPPVFRVGFDTWLGHKISGLGKIEMDWPQNFGFGSNLNRTISSIDIFGINFEFQYLTPNLPICPGSIQTLCKS